MKKIKLLSIALLSVLVSVLFTSCEPFEVSDLEGTWGLLEETIRDPHCPNSNDRHPYDKPITAITFVNKEDGLWYYESELKNEEWVRSPNDFRVATKGDYISIKDTTYNVNITNHGKILNLYYEDDTKIISREYMKMILK